jgi:hypothetical protein
MSTLESRKVLLCMLQKNAPCLYFFLFIPVDWFLLLGLDNVPISMKLFFFSKAPWNFVNNKNPRKLIHMCIFYIKQTVTSKVFYLMFIGDHMLSGTISFFYKHSTHVYAYIHICTFIHMNTHTHTHCTHIITSNSLIHEILRLRNSPLKHCIPPRE